MDGEVFSVFLGLEHLTAVWAGQNQGHGNRDAAYEALAAHFAAILASATVVVINEDVRRAATRAEYILGYALIAPTIDWLNWLAMLTLIIVQKTPVVLFFELDNIGQLVSFEFLILG
jgi:hypothetical protein